MRQLSFLSLTLLLLLLAFKIHAKSEGVFALQGLGLTTYHAVKSSQEKSPYHLIVRLPDKYDNTKSYPTMYLLDGGISFPLLSSYYHYLRFTNEIPALIIVGISYGTDDWQLGNNRSTDYTAKSSQREHWGGAEKFQNLLQTKIIPLIENNYASDPEKRLIFGNSLAGQFVLYTAITKPELFSGHIASNPALHRNLPFFLNKENVGSFVALQSKLFVSSGSKDDSQFREPAAKWMHYWSSQKKIPWKLKTETLHNEGHMSAIPSAFFRGTQWIFAAH